MDTHRISRRGFVGSAIVGAGGSALASAADGEASSGPFRMLCAPVLTNPTPNGITAIWATSAPATGWIEYGETEQLGMRARGIVQGLAPYEERTIKVRLRGLKPGTRYFYRAVAEHTTYDWHEGIKRASDAAAASEIYDFTTPNPAADEVRFTVWNDTHENDETLRGVFAAHQESPGDFLLWNGDLTNDLYDEPKMVDQFLHPAGLPFAARTPYYFVRGNHDVRGPYARRIAEVTDVPDNRHYYAFRQGPLAAIVLDTGEDKPDDHRFYAGLCDFASFRARQAKWLARAIRQPSFRNAPFRVLFCHIPLWWLNDAHTGTYCLDGQRKWHDLLVEGGVQLVVSGHTHDAQHLSADSRHPYVQLTGGGPKPEQATYLRGQATRDRLIATQHRLDGQVLHTVELPAV